MNPAWTNPQFLEWASTRRGAFTWKNIQASFAVSRATAYRWMQRWRQFSQPDLLDYVIDNPETGRREIYRDGAMKACVPRTCLSAPMVRSYGVTGPWGTYPPRGGADAAQFEHAVEVVRSGNRASGKRLEQELGISKVKALALIERMELAGIVTPLRGDNTRMVIR